MLQHPVVQQQLAQRQQREEEQQRRVDEVAAGMEIYELLSLSRDVSTRKLAPDWLHKSQHSTAN